MFVKRPILIFFKIIFILGSLTSSGFAFALIRPNPSVQNAMTNVPSAQPVPQRLPARQPWQASGFFPMMVLPTDDCKHIVQAYEAQFTKNCRIDYSGSSHNERSVSELKRNLKTKCSTEKCTKLQSQAFKQVAQVCQIDQSLVDVYLGVLRISHDLECMKIDDEYCVADIIGTQQRFLTDFESRNGQGASTQVDNLVELPGGQQVCTSCSVQWSMRYIDKSEVFTEYYASDPSHSSLMNELQLDYHRALKFVDKCPTNLKVATKFVKSSAPNHSTFSPLVSISSIILFFSVILH